MVRQIAPVFFTTDIPATLAYYTGKLGFECLGTRQDPPVYAIMERDQQVIHFRCAQPPTANPDKYPDELLRVSGFVLTNPEQTSLPVRRRCRRTLCRVRRPRRGIHSGTWQHAMAHAGVRGEGLRRPSAGFRREPAEIIRKHPVCPQWPNGATTHVYVDRPISRVFFDSLFPVCWCEPL